MNRPYYTGLVERLHSLRASCFLFLLALILPQLSAGATGPLQLPSFKSLPNDRALIQNSVQGIAQDSAGFLWIATLGGLHRFDGLDMVLVNDLGTPENKFRILQVTAVAVAPNENVWAGGTMSEVARINASDETIDHFGTFASQFDFEKDTKIKQIIIQPSGVVWIKNDVALVKFDPNTQKFERPTINFPANWGSEVDFSIESLDDNQLIIHNGTNLGVLNLKNNIVTLMTDTEGNPLPLNSVNQCQRLRDGSLWTCGPAGQIGKIEENPSGYQLELWQTPTESFFTDISMDLDGYIWLSVDRRQVVRWSPEGNLLEDVGIDINYRLSRDMDPIRTLFNDRSGVMWMGTGSFGLLKVDPSLTRFSSIREESAISTGFQDPYLWDIKEDDDGLIIAGRGELGRLSLGDGVYKRIFNDSFLLDGERKITLYTVLPLGERKMLLGFRFQGLGIYDEETKKFERLEIYQKPGDPRPEVGVPSLLERDKSGKIWVFFNKGTWLLSTDGTRREEIPSRLIAALKNYQVRAWAQHENGVLSFGTERHGLIQYDPRTDQVATWEHNEDPRSLPHNGVRGLCYDDLGNLLVGTYDGLGLLPALSTSEDKNPFQVFTTADGLPNNTIYSILPGNDGTFWMSTNIGVSHFDPIQQTFINYDERDGIADNEFNGGAALMASNGCIYLGGVNGLTWFDPARMYTNSVMPIANILQVTTDLDSHTNTLGNVDYDQFHLPWDGHFFDLKLAATCFQQPEKQKVSYRIAGVVSDWRVSPRGETINLAHLPAGDHILNYRVSNNDGVWSATKSIVISVASPPWLRPFAFLIYLIVVVLSLAFLIVRRRQISKQRAERNLQLAMADKLGAVGQLAAGMAHDFNNQLQIIMGNAELLDMELPAGHPGKAPLQVISTTGRRAGVLTSRLLTYAKESEPNRAVLDLDQVVSDMMDLIASFLGSRVELSFKKLPGQKNILANRDQLEQVLVNLCLNSRDAIVTQGNLEIRTSVNEANPNDRRCLCEVRDDGSGVDDDLKARVFEPFFSSKEMGSGLGLSMVKRIITQHGGSVAVSNNELGGATFTFDLPAATSQMVPREVVAVPVQPAAVVQDTVLVADDVASVNLLTTTILSRAGYRVVSVKNGAEGIAALREHPEIRLAVLDVMMPIMDGRAVFDFIIAEKLEIPVIFCTGFSFSALEDSALKELEAPVLSKPFSSADLLALVRKVGLRSLAENKAAKK